MRYHNDKFDSETPHHAKQRPHGKRHIMARSVKETPILTGKDAKRFEQAIKANENKPITPQERERIQDAWRQFEVVTEKRVKN